jgi:hypothetical protein
MRKLLIALVAATIATLGGAGGTAGADNQGADWLAAGTATLMPPPQFGAPMLHVNAQSNFGGANVRGHFWIRYDNGGGEFGGPIVCLDVAGNAAAMYGRVDQIKTPRAGIALGEGIPIRLLDMGSPGTADMANFDILPTVPNSPACLQNPGYVPISQGNYVIHDQPVADLLGLDQLLSQFEAAADDPYG